MWKTYENRWFPQENPLQMVDFSASQVWSEDGPRIDAAPPRPTAEKIAMDEFRTQLGSTNLYCCNFTQEIAMGLEHSYGYGELPNILFDKFPN